MLNKYTLHFQGKVFLVFKLNATPHSGSIVPRILNLDPRWTWVDTFRASGRFISGNEYMVSTE